MKSIRTHGKGSNKYDNVRVGLNGRLDTIQAAILLAKMEIFDEEIELRQEVAKLYSDILPNDVKKPKIDENNRSAWAQYSVLSSSREKKLEKLSNNEIPFAIYYPKPLHLQEAFSNLKYCVGDFPVAERISKEIFSLPFHPYLDEVSITKIAISLKQASSGE